jgi:hypothetical protein
VIIDTVFKRNRTKNDKKLSESDASDYTTPKKVEKSDNVQGELQILLKEDNAFGPSTILGEQSSPFQDRDTEVTPAL